MRLFSFRIQNFKSIIDTGEIKISETDPVTIFAGQNEAGKSAILEALYFFEIGADLVAFNETNRRADTFPRVECTYYLTIEELEELEKQSSKKIRSCVEKRGFKFVRGITESDNFEQIKYHTTAELRQAIEEFNTLVTTPSPEPPSEGEASTPTSQLSKFDATWLFEKRPKFIFYSSFTDVLPNKITRAQLGGNNAVMDFQRVFNVDFQMLLDDESERSQARKINTVNESASDNLNKYWSQKLESEPVSYRYQIQINIHPTNPDESTVTFLIDQGDNNPLYFGQKSNGFRWFSSFNLRLRAHEVTAGKFDEFILLIDEPGQGLHEEAQRDAKNVINEIGQKGFQILFTTHQSQLLKDGNDVTLSRIKLVIKSKSEGTKIKNPAQQTSQAAFRDALSPVRTAMGLISLDVSSFQSSRKTIVVEGITDYYYLKALLKAYVIEDVTIIPSAGVSQISSVYAILYGWGVAAAIMVDDDTPGTKAVNDVKKNFLEGISNEDLEKVIYKNVGCRGIEDTFGQLDFLSFAEPYLPQKDPNKTNAEIAKLNTSKEIIARTFYDKVTTGELTLGSFDDSTQARIAKIIRFASA